MIVIKCKMCGGDLQIEPGRTVAKCEYCGTLQTLPRVDNDRRSTMYERAGHFRRNNDFDKAMGIYEQILNEDNTDAEAYWSLVLCRYGIEYVEDPATHRRVPTVNRAQYTSIFADEDYKSAITYADDSQKAIYEGEAKAIDEIQRGILEISRKEAPFDVFICYKETDSSGRRTRDSVLANELYHQLTQEGFKVFFSRITLEDKLGTAYEPYIFAALNSAKAMVVLGTKSEYFNAVWVKNEWSRYLSLIKNGAKKTLIPAYRDMDPYDLPEEFSHLQAQDMSKLGFMQDLIRGIKKIVTADTPKPVIHENIVVNTEGVNVDPLLKRAYMFLEDGDWDSAKEYCEKVLDQDPENARAYLGELMAELHVREQDRLNDCEKPFDDNKYYQKAIRFASPELEKALKGYISFINSRNEREAKAKMYEVSFDALAEMELSEEARKIAAKKRKAIIAISAAALIMAAVLLINRVAIPNRNYNRAVSLLEDGQYEQAGRLFEELGSYKDAENGKHYAEAKLLQQSGEYDRAISEFERSGAYRDAADQIVQCRNVIEAEKAAQELANKPADPVPEETELIPEESQKRPSGKTICGDYGRTYAINTDGALVFAGSQKDQISGTAYFEDFSNKLANFNDLVALAPTNFFLVGLKSNGAVVTTREIPGVEDMHDIVSITADAENGHDYHVLGLRSDGTVAKAGSFGYGDGEVDDWSGIVAIDACSGNTLGLKADGTVISIGTNDYGQANVGDWRDIVSISAGELYNLGLKADGTAVATGINVHGQCDVGQWKDIVAISAGPAFAMGLKSDGTVEITSKSSIYSGVKEWTDIVDIYATQNVAIGLKSDGTAVAVAPPPNEYMQYSNAQVSDWKDIMLPERCR